MAIARRGAVAGLVVAALLATAGVARSSTRLPEPFPGLSREEELARVLDQWEHVALVRVRSIAAETKPETLEFDLKIEVRLRSARLQVLRSLRGDLDTGVLDVVTVSGGLSERPESRAWAALAGVDTAGAIVVLFRRPRGEGMVPAIGSGAFVDGFLPLDGRGMQEVDALVDRARSKIDLDSLAAQSDLVIVGSIVAQTERQLRPYEGEVAIERTIKGRSSTRSVRVRSRLPLYSMRGLFFLQRGEDGVYDTAPAHRPAWAIDRGNSNSGGATFEAQIQKAEAAVARSASAPNR
jgi:hypothetical protein